MGRPCRLFGCFVFVSLSLSAFGSFQAIVEYKTVYLVIKLLIDEKASQKAEKNRKEKEIEVNANLSYHF